MKKSRFLFIFTWPWLIGIIFCLFTILYQSSVWAQFGDAACENGSIPLLPTTYVVVEGGSPFTYPLSLCKAPTDLVVVTIKTDKTAENQLLIKPTEVFTFTTKSWRTPQPVEIEIINDKDNEVYQKINLYHTTKSEDEDYDHPETTDTASLHIWVQDDDSAEYLPIIRRPLPTQTPTVTPTSTPAPTPAPIGRLGLANNQLASTTINFQDNRIYAGDLRNGSSGGGIFSRAIQNSGSECINSGPFDPEYIAFGILDIAFNNEVGIAGTFGNRIVYRTESGWQNTGSSINQNVYSVVFTANGLFAGSDSGVYRSTDNGITWSPVGGPDDINVVYPHGDNLWIGNFGNGVAYTALANPGSYQVVNQGLTGNALRVWDIIVHDDQIYIATSNGVFQKTLSAAEWQVSGLQGKWIYSLAVVTPPFMNEAQLIAGTNGSGLYSAPISNSSNWQARNGASDWNPTEVVRDLNYYSDYCGGGLFAATNNGLWFFGRLP